MTAANNPAETDEQLAKAWGFSVRRPKLSREALIGLTAIIALLGVFGYVVVKNWRSRATVVAEKTNVDKEVKPAGGTDPFGEGSQVLKTKFDNGDNPPGKDLPEEIGLEIGVGQSEPQLDLKKPALPKTLVEESDDSEFNPFGDAPKTGKPVNVAQPSIDDNLEPKQESPRAKPNRAAASLGLDLDEPTTRRQSPRPNDIETDDPMLTRTDEPIRLKQPIKPEPSVDEQFQEPVRVKVARRSPNELEAAPQPTRRPARMPREDAFTENVPSGFDDSQPSPTTDLPPARGRQLHPLLREDEYLVDEGDNFCVICKKLYGSEKYYLALAEHNHNRVADPCRMRPGLILSAPPRNLLEGRYATLIPKPKAPVEAKGEKPHSARKVTAAPLPTGMFYDENGAAWYRVGKGDTLSGIAQAHLGRTARAEQIVNLNRERLPDPHKLQLGQELRLPNDASQVRLVETDKTVR